MSSGTNILDFDDLPGDDLNDRVIRSTARTRLITKEVGKVVRACQNASGRALKVARLKDLVEHGIELTQSSLLKPPSYLDATAQAATPAQLHELTILVLGLARTLRSKKRLGFSQSAKLVEQRWTTIRLRRFLERSRARAGEFQTRRPIPPQAVKHFDRINRIAHADTAGRPNAQSFLRDLRALRSGTMKLSDVQWVRYEKLLTDDGMLKPETAFEVPVKYANARCAAVFLELEREWLMWEREKEKHELSGSAYAPLSKWHELIGSLDSQATWGRILFGKAWAAMKRKQRSRRKIAAQKA